MLRFTGIFLFLVSSAFSLQIHGGYRASFLQWYHDNSFSDAGTNNFDIEPLLVHHFTGHLLFEQARLEISYATSNFQRAAFEADDPANAAPVNDYRAFDLVSSYHILPMLGIMGKIKFGRLQQRARIDETTSFEVDEQTFSGENRFPYNHGFLETSLFLFFDADEKSNHTDLAMGAGVQYLKLRRVQPFRVDTNSSTLPFQITTTSDYEGIQPTVGFVAYHLGPAFQVRAHLLFGPVLGSFSNDTFSEKISTTLFRTELGFEFGYRFTPNLLGYLGLNSEFLSHRAGVLESDAGNQAVTFKNSYGGLPAGTSGTIATSANDWFLQPYLGITFTY